MAALQDYAAVTARNTPLLLEGREPWWSTLFYWGTDQWSDCLAATDSAGWLFRLKCQLLGLLMSANPLCLFRFFLWLLFLWSTWTLTRGLHGRLMHGESLLGPSYHSFVSRQKKQS
jgi:hypothetical protein